MKHKILIFLFIMLMINCNVLIAEVAIDPVAVAARTSVGNIVLAGMLIVFLSLIIVASIISLFKHLNKTKTEPRKEDDTTFTKKISSIAQVADKKTVPPVDQKVLTAIITMIFLHENEVENQSKMLLTMKRAKMSQWKQASKTSMPNESFGNVPTLKMSKPVEKK